MGKTTTPSRVVGGTHKPSTPTRTHTRRHTRPPARGIDPVLRTHDRSTYLGTKDAESSRIPTICSSNGIHHCTRSCCRPHQPQQQQPVDMSFMNTTCMFNNPINPINVVDIFEPSTDPLDPYFRGIITLPAESLLEESLPENQVSLLEELLFPSEEQDSLLEELLVPVDPYLSIPYLSIPALSDIVDNILLGISGKDVYMSHPTSQPPSPSILPEIHIRNSDALDAPASHTAMEAYNTFTEALDG